MELAETRFQGITTRIYGAIKPIENSVSPTVAAFADVISLLVGGVGEVWDDSD